MQELGSPLLRPVLLYLLVLARVGGLVTFAPFWGHKSTAKQVRVMLALALALVLTPVVAPRLPPPPADAISLLLLLASELLIGCAFGFVGRMVLSGLEIAAHIFTFQMGYSLVSTIDPATQSQVTALSVLAQMLVLLLLLAGDGHHWFLLATANSYQHVAPGHFVFTPTLAQLLLRLSADALAVGVALAAPAIVALLAVELALAIAGQVVPQLQVFVLSFPLKIIVGLWLVGGALFFLPGAVRTTLSALREALTHTLAAMT